MPHEIRGVDVEKYELLCQETSPKRWFRNMEMTSNCDITNNEHQIQMTTIWPWTNPPPMKIFCVRHCGHSNAYWSGLSCRPTRGIAPVGRKTLITVTQLRKRQRSTLICLELNICTNTTMFPLFFSSSSWFVCLCSMNIKSGFGRKKISGKSWDESRSGLSHSAANASRDLGFN